MTPTAMAIGLLFALGVLAVALNHLYARIAVVELTLNEGLPPGHGEPTTTVSAVDERHALGPGIHIFVSRTCHACQRLVDELARAPDPLPSPVHVRYVDRPRPAAQAAAERHGARLTDHELDLSQSLGANPLPFTIVVGDHELVGRSVTPTLALVIETARNAGVFTDVEVA